MSERTGRFIYSKSNHRHISELLQMIFVAELLRPSKCLWLVSPWVSDIPIIDNQVNQFLALEPTWSHRWVRFSEVLSQIAYQGTSVHIATRPDPHNRPFIEALRDVVDKDRLPVRFHQSEELHEKGILGDGYYLSGSMNFTFNGITINEEALHYHTNTQLVAEKRLVLVNRWGGEICE